jgi:hypothetical protein
MMFWKLIINIGHTAVMLPLAGAIAAWIITARAWRLALCWCVLFAAGLSVVALSKIAFLGWKFGIPPLEFKALSGHAFRATAVLPVLFFVLLHGTSRSRQKAGVAFGIGVSIGLGVLLVHFKFHTASEVVPSFLLGIFVSLGYMRIATTMPAPQLNQWVVPISLLVFIVFFSLKPSSVSPRLVDVALYFSGRDRPYEWSKKLICEDRGPRIGKTRLYP